MNPVDPTMVIESMARRLHRHRAEHPVAGALTQATRGRLRLDRPGYAQRIGTSVLLVESCERGDVPLGDLPGAVGPLALELGADLLALADLEARLRHPSRGNAAEL